MHSCLWGLYDDVLVADILGLEPVHIPLRAGVVGSPIRLHDATLGLSNITSPPTSGSQDTSTAVAFFDKSVKRGAEMFEDTADNMTGMVVYFNPKGTKTVEAPKTAKKSPAPPRDDDPSRFSV